MTKTRLSTKSDHENISLLLPEEVLFNGRLRMKFFEVPVFEDLAVLIMGRSDPLIEVIAMIKKGQMKVRAGDEKSPAEKFYALAA